MAATLVRADGEDPERYLAALATIGRIDKDRTGAVHESTGERLLYGYGRGPHWGYEIHGYGTVDETGNDSGSDFYRWGVGADGTYAFLPHHGLRPFLLAGLGYGRDDVQPNSLDMWDWNANAGAGFVTTYRLLGLFAIRGELRGSYDHYGARVSGRGFIDYHVGLGVELPIALARPEIIREEPVRVVPVAPADRDDDGVLDERDACPDTPEGVLVDHNGCALAPVTRLDGVTFEFDKTRLRPDALTILKGVAETLVRYPQLQVEIAGHTDSMGSDAYNLKLSQRRAEAVRSALIALGIDAKSIMAVGYGEAQPVASNDTDAGRELNRRVELRVKNLPPQNQRITPGAETHLPR